VICISTRGAAPHVSFAQAVVAGLAPDGGLYMPQRIEAQSEAWWGRLRGRPFRDVAVAMAGRLVGDEIPESSIEAILREALNFDVPIVPLDDRLAAVELFHGPTFAFKDVGARVLARLMSYLQPVSAGSLTVLVATSGDTGSAVAQAFYGVPRTRVVVLYPHGQVSAVQEAQFTTLGGNVTAVAVSGTFDDCQRLAKASFADPALARRVRLTSANSISLGRLLPQMFYYGYAALQQPAGADVTVAVPSGNFGNLVAGVMAQRMGVPIQRFVAATTINDTVPRYLATGRVEPRPSVATLASAMDVGHPSNLERLQWLFHGDLGAMRAVMTASVHTDDEVRAAIREMHATFGYVADPHTAIGYLGAIEHLRHSRHLGHPRHLFLATAHPAKFRETVEPAVGRPVPLPAALADAMARPRQAMRIDPTLEALADLL
jgi:threonine synthase